ncbi:MAG TPA: hypothetical protein VGA75_02405, partial [Paracoccaceae bacterium]
SETGDESWNYHLQASGWFNAQSGKWEPVFRRHPGKNPPSQAEIAGRNHGADARTAPESPVRKISRDSPPKNRQNVTATITASCPA